MKKIILKIMFMSVVSMMAFAGDINGDQTNEFLLFGAGFPHGDGIRRLRDVRLNIRAYQTLEDFVDYLRNNIAPNGYPFVEGEITTIAMNYGRNLPLDTQIVDLNINNRDSFMIVYRCVDNQAVAEQEEAGTPVAEQEDDDSVEESDDASSYVDLVDDDDNSDEDEVYSGYDFDQQD